MRVDVPARLPPVSGQSGTKGRLLPALVLIAWLVLGAAGATAPGGLAEVQRNDGESFLPASSEATEVVRLQEQIAGGKILPALVVFTRPWLLPVVVLTSAGLVARRDQRTQWQPTNRSRQGRHACLAITKHASGTSRSTAADPGAPPPPAAAGKRAGRRFRAAPLA